MPRTFFLLAFLLLPLVTHSQPKPYPYRWVFVMNNLRSDDNVESIRAVIKTAAQHGLNGMVLSAGLDRVELQPPEFIERVKKIKAICDEHHIELIPQIFSAGYGSGILAFDRNLAEGLKVSGALYMVKNGEATIHPDPQPVFTNGGFEESTKESTGAIDKTVHHDGAASLRIDDPNGRITREIVVKPHRLYRLTGWVKTEELTPSDRFRISITGTDNRAQPPVYLHVPATTDWRKLTLGFNSIDSDRVRIGVGMSGGKSGKFWLDDFSVEEIGLVNVLRRPGTPITVRGETSGTTYQEGRDYSRIEDPQLTFKFDHDGPPIKIPAGSRIKDGERLRVDYYHGISLHDGQVTVCMSEPKVYDIWREQARRLHQLLAPQKYLLSMDEIRAGGSDVACKNRNTTMAKIVGECLTRQFDMIRANNPKAAVYTWSDMLDPNHNAHGNYYYVEGDYTGSWEHVPKDIGIMCWYYERRDKSLPFFSGRGHRTFAGAYYDGDTLENPKGWLESLDKTPNAMGIMYTTWRRKYELLPAFGDLVLNHPKP